MLAASRYYLQLMPFSRAACKSGTLRAAQSSPVELIELLATWNSFRQSVPHDVEILVALLSDLLAGKAGVGRPEASRQSTAERQASSNGWQRHVPEQNAECAIAALLCRRRQRSAAARRLQGWPSHVLLLQA